MNVHLLYSINQPFHNNPYRSSDSTRYGTNKSSGASSGSHRKSACGVSNNGGSGGAGPNAYNSIMAQTVSNQQRHNSFYVPQRQQAHSQYPSTNPNSSSLAPIHNHHSVTSQLGTNNNNCNSSLTNSNSGCHDKNTVPSSYHSTSTTGNSAKGGNNNRLLNYTTFENNQYKFSLNNVFSAKHSTPGGGNNISHLDSFLEMPHSAAAAPYYYNGPPTTNVHLKKRDAKSDIGVQTRRGSASSTKPITKTQLLTGQAPGGAGFYPSLASPSYGGGNSCLASRLHPAKSDLFLSYIHSTAGATEFERPHIYNYKMPQMPEFMRQQQQKTPTAAYHISGAQTSDLPPLYKPPSTSGGGGGGAAGSGNAGILYAGAAPSNDVVYYQFDAGQHSTAPIVQQPKANASKDSYSAIGSNVGPLVFLQRTVGQNVTTSSAVTAKATAAMQQTVSSIACCVLCVVRVPRTHTCAYIVACP